MRNQGDCPHRGELVYVPGTLHYVPRHSDKPCPLCAEPDKGETVIPRGNPGCRFDLTGRFLKDLDVLIKQSPAAMPLHALAELHGLAARLSSEDWLRLLLVARSLALITPMSEAGQDGGAVPLAESEVQTELLRMCSLLHRSLHPHEAKLVRAGHMRHCTSAEEFLAITARHEGSPVSDPTASPRS